MEITAVIEALRILKTPTVVEIVSDSQYLVNAGKSWLKKWRARGWHRNGKPYGHILNADLWQQLDELLAGHEVTWRWVKAHAKNANNNEADRLANQARKAELFTR